jgi:hypothetical protein
MAVLLQVLLLMQGIDLYMWLEQITAFAPSTASRSPAPGYGTT